MTGLSKTGVKTGDMATELGSIETKNTSFVNLEVSDGNRLLGVFLQLVKPRSQCYRWWPVHVKTAYFNKIWNTMEHRGIGRGCALAVYLHRDFKFAPYAFVNFERCVRKTTTPAPNNSSFKYCDTKRTTMQRMKIEKPLCAYSLQSLDNCNNG